MRGFFTYFGAGFSVLLSVQTAPTLLGGRDILMIKDFLATDFGMGFVVLVMPILVVLAYSIGREKVQNIWLNGYSAGYKDGSKS